ncbi:nitroreductase family protein [Planosporangium flavigriseum]|uniref:nitroreductase family protein n=1 Tax=Planosporangium flavigriseum TaxID=373681 RepID=UPI001438807B|nr:nitroreductase family protein [Planosporangium flavigriseum]NJC66861.1 nitroreductase family protein [Planosporangium flavigriseum]
MEYGDVVRKRRMVRNYDPDRPVPAEVVRRLLGYAVHAPSAGFSQGWGFLVLEEPDDRQAFWAATTPAGMAESGWSQGMRRAPLIVVPHSNRDVYLERYAEPDKGWTDRRESRWPVPYWHVDAGFASLLMLLGAVDEGLGACFFGIPPESIPGYRKAFDVPDAYTPIGAITIGYGAADRRSPSLRRGRREMAQVTHRGRWGVGYENRHA